MKYSHLLYQLYINKNITKERFDELQQSLQAEKLTSIYYTFFALGLTLLISGLLFFVASNWHSIPNFVKLLSLQVLFIATVAIAYVYQAKRFVFASFTLLSAILIGLNLAVFGQVYQTGADAYTLFATWTVLISLWAWTLKLPYLFMLWHILLYLSLLLFIDQYVHPFLEIRVDTITIFLTLLSNALLALSLYKKELRIFNKPNRILLLASALFFTSIATYEKVFSHHVNLGNIHFVLFIVQASLLAYYFHKQKNLFSIGLVLLNILMFTEVLLARFIFSGSLLSVYAGSFFFFAFMTIFLTISTSMLLKHLNKSYKGMDS